MTKRPKRPTAGVRKRYPVSTSLTLRPTPLVTEPQPRLALEHVDLAVDLQPDGVPEGRDGGGICLAHDDERMPDRRLADTAGDVVLVAERLDQRHGRCQRAGRIDAQLLGPDPHD